MYKIEKRAHVMTKGCRFTFYAFEKKKQVANAKMLYQFDEGRKLMSMVRTSGNELVLL